MAKSCIINPCQKGMTPDTCPHNPLLGCDCEANSPSAETFYITTPIYGVRITCYKCAGFFKAGVDVPINYEPGVYFHEGCFNRYEHYYGLDKPID